MVNRSISPSCIALAVAALGTLAGVGEAHAQATLLNGYGGPADFGIDQVIRADDESSPTISIARYFPAGVNVDGTVFTDVYVNINGNISFGTAVRDFTPVAFPGATIPIVAAWWADVDTRLADAGIENDGVYWHVEQGLMVATWFEVGYFDQHRDLRNTFQIVMRDASASGSPGDVDLEFRYNRCEWTTGDASGGDGGTGGTIAFAGYDFTSLSGGTSSAFSVLPGSGTDAVLNLCTDSNVGQPGVWALQVRAGVVTYCGNGTVDPNEECDPTASSFPECTDDCHLCTPSTCVPADVIEQDIPFEDVPAFDVPEQDVPGFDVPEVDASIDANPNQEHSVQRYGGGGLIACSVPAGQSGRGAFGSVLLALAAGVGVVIRRRRKRGLPTDV